MSFKTIAMSLEPDDVSIDPLKCLWYGGIHPALDYRLTKIIVPLNLLVCASYFVLAVIGVYVSYTENIFYMAECVQTCILMTHSLGKIWVLYYKRDDILKLIQEKAHFWKMKNFDGKIFKECRGISELIRKNIRTYYFISLVATVTFDLQPFLTGQLPTECYKPPGWSNFLAVLLWYLSFFVYFCLVGTDGFFCSLAVSLVIQFKLLAHKFQTAVSPKTNLIKLREELRILINYHSFLLKYCINMNVAFSGIFLIQFLITIASASLSVFIFMQPGSWTNRAKFVMYFIVMICESSFYCIPLEFVTSAAIQIGDALCESRWYEVKISQVKKNLVLIIAKTQKLLIFSGYGLVYINLQTFVIICKTVFSFYTYLNNVRKT